MATLRVQDGCRLLHAVFDPSSGGAAWPTSKYTSSICQFTCSACQHAQEGLILAQCAAICIKDAMELVRNMFCAPRFCSAGTSFLISTSNEKILIFTGISLQEIRLPRDLHAAALTGS